MPRERDGNWREAGVGTASQDGGRLTDTTTGTLADKKQGQFVTKSQTPDPLPLRRLPLFLTSPVPRLPLWPAGILPRL